MISAQIRVMTPARINATTINCVRIKPALGMAQKNCPRIAQAKPESPFPKNREETISTLLLGQLCCAAWRENLCLVQ
jgi:hypothetical protein